MSLSDKIKATYMKEFGTFLSLNIEDVKEALKELKKRMIQETAFQYSTGESLIIKKINFDINEIFGSKLT